MENSSKIYIYQIIYRKEKNKRRVNSAKKRGRQWGMKGEKRKERRVGCGSVGKEGQVYRWKIRKDRVVRELTTRSRIGKWRCPILPVSDPTSTFGVRKLNFCVRYGNRWNLSAIITTMVIYQTIMVKHIRIMFLNTMYPFSEVILSLTLCLIYSASPPFKNFFLSISFPEDWQLHSKLYFLVQTQISSCFHFISS